jgi:hypothetical protein
MLLGEVLYESEELQHVHFPTTGAIVSLLYVMVDGASAEIALVGMRYHRCRPVHGGDTMPNRAVVQRGYAYRLKGKLLKEEFNA